MKPTTIEQPTTNGATAAPADPQPLTPRQRQRLAEDEIVAIEAKYRVVIVGVVKTVNSGQQLITWEVAPLPDKNRAMSDLTVSATFTKNSGQPATGLILAEINLYLTQQDRATGADTVVWDGTQNPTAEMDNVGAYIRILSSTDLDTYNYFAAAEYTGAEVLDSDWITGAVSLNNVPIGTAIEWEYPVTNNVTGLPIEGARVVFATDTAGDNVIWAGYTDTFGIARDDAGNLPRLDAGTYYVRTRHSGFVFPEYDTEVVQ